MFKIDKNHKLALMTFNIKIVINSIHLFKQNLMIDQLYSMLFLSHVFTTFIEKN